MDIDSLLQNILSRSSQLMQLKNKFYPRARWQPKKPLRLLLVGYTGARNTGSDVRTAEIVRQLQHLLKYISVELTVCSLNPNLSQGYYPDAKQIQIPLVFPPFLIRECPKYDGVIACEGSMFKSQFATALSTMLVGALGMANANNKLSVGYGVEAGEMVPNLKKFSQEQCKKSLIICRNVHSRTLLDKLNIRTISGTDTAWTFNSGTMTHAEALLRQSGWDGKKMLLAIAPINPYWWPVTPSLKKTMVHLLSKKYAAQHYKSIYFHHHSEEAEIRYQHYINSIAEGVRVFSQHHRVFPILIGMEHLDRKACNALSEKMGGNIPQFISDEHNMYEMVSLLRHADLLLSSRFHAIVTTMPALVPSAGITMDERIYNLMHDRQHPDLVTTTDDPLLADKVNQMLETLHSERERIKQDLALNVTQQLKCLGEMGKALMEELASIYPDMPPHHLGQAFEHYLPELPASLISILEGVA